MDACPPAHSCRLSKELLKPRQLGRGHGNAHTRELVARVTRLAQSFEGEKHSPRAFWPIHRRQSGRDNADVLHATMVAVRGLPDYDSNLDNHIQSVAGYRYPIRQGKWTSSSFYRIESGVLLAGRGVRWGSDGRVVIEQ